MALASSDLIKHLGPALATASTLYDAFLKLRIGTGKRIILPLLRVF